MKDIIIFIGGALLGGIVGVICTALLQKPVDNFIGKILRRIRGSIRSRSPIRIPFHFAFGPLETTALIIDGDAEEIYLKENIHCHFNPKAIEFPDSLRDLIDNVPSIQEEIKLSGKTHMWNGQLYALSSYTRSRTSDDERLELHLWFQPSDWYTHYATGLSLDITKVIDQDIKKELTLREKYIAPINWSSPSIQPVKYFSNTFAIAMCLITKDNKLVIVQRSGEVVNSNQYSISINETLQRPTDKAKSGSAPDIYKTVIRGTSEEMGFEPEEKDIVFFALCADSDSCCWVMQGMVKSSYTIDEINNFRRNRAKDKYENQNLIILNFEIDTIVKFVLNNGPWAGGAPACIYYTLTHEFKKKSVDEAISKFM